MSRKQFVDACIPELVEYRRITTIRLRMACRQRQKRTHLRKLLRDVTLTLMIAQQKQEERAP